MPLDQNVKTPVLRILSELCGCLVLFSVLSVCECVGVWCCFQLCLFVGVWVSGIVFSSVENSNMITENYNLEVLLVTWLTRPSLSNLALEVVRVCKVVRHKQLLRGFLLAITFM